MSAAWIVLILSGMLEAVWATALDASKGFKRLRPTLVFFGALLASMVGLSYAMGSIAVGTAYAVWVGIGAVLTAAWAMLTKQDRASVIKVLLLLGLIGCVVGLKAVS